MPSRTRHYYYNYYNYYNYNYLKANRDLNGYDGQLSANYTAGQLKRPDNEKAYRVRSSNKFVFGVRYWAASTRAQ